MFNCQFIMHIRFPIFIFVCGLFFQTVAISVCYNETQTFTFHIKFNKTILVWNHVGCSNNHLHVSDEYARVWSLIVIYMYTTPFTQSLDSLSIDDQIYDGSLKHAIKLHLPFNIPLSLQSVELFLILLNVFWYLSDIDISSKRYFNSYQTSVYYTTHLIPSNRYVILEVFHKWFSQHNTTSPRRQKCLHCDCCHIVMSHSERHLSQHLLFRDVNCCCGFLTGCIVVVVTTVTNDNIHSIQWAAAFHHDPLHVSSVPPHTHAVEVEHN